MTKIVIDIFMYLFQLLLLWHYSETLFTPKRSKPVRIGIMLLNTVFLGVVYQLNITYLNVILMFVTYIALLLYLYNIPLKNAAFHSLIFMAVMLASEILMMAVSSVLYQDFNALENSTEAYLFVVITSKLIYFGIMIIILRIFAQKEHNEPSNKYFWILLVMPLTSVLVLLCFRYVTYEMRLMHTMSILWTASCIGLLFANILIFIIYEFSIKNTSELYELKTIQRQEEQDKLYFEIIEQANNDMRVLTHDIKNHLQQIRNSDNLEDIYTYVDKLYPDIEKFSRLGISKNKMLDLIISKYSKLCRGKDIRLDIDVKTSNLSYIDDVDLSTMMNNLLDNAVEAAEQSKNPFIQVNIFSKNSVYDALVIKNSCDSNPRVADGKLKTTKSDKKIHGIGTHSINKVIKKYDAIYDWKYDENQKVFQTDIVFPK